MRALGASGCAVSLVEFLLARIEEDEALARPAAPGPWHVDAESTEVLAVDGIVVADGFALSGPQTRATTAHIARHDPVRILVECEAKRRIVEECAPNVAKDWPFPDGLNLSEFVVAELVQPYADHPDFDPAWGK